MGGMVKFRIELLESHVPKYRRRKYQCLLPLSGLGQRLAIKKNTIKPSFNSID